MRVAPTESTGVAAAVADWRRGSLWKFVDLAAANGFRFLAGVIFARRLGVEAFGWYAFLFMFVSIAITATNFGLPTAAARFVSAQESRGGLRLLLRHVLRIRVATLVPTVLVTVLVARLLGPRWVPALAEPGLLLLVGGYLASQAMLILMEYIAAGLTAYRQFVMVATSLRESVRVAGLAVFLFATQPTVQMALLVELLTAAAGLMGAAIVVWRRLEAPGTQAVVDVPSAPEIRRFARETTPVTILSLASDWLGQLLVLMLGSTIALASYTVAWRCAAVVLTLLPISGPTLMPALARVEADDRRALVSEALPSAGELVAWLSILTAAAGAIAIPWVFGREYLPAALLIIPLAVTLPGRVIAPAARQILLLHGKGTRASRALILGAATTVVFAILFRNVANAGAVVAWSLVLGSTVELVAAAAFVRSEGYHLRTGPRRTASFVLLYAGAAIAWLLLRA